MGLLLPYGQFDVIGEGTQIKIMLIASQHVGDNALLALHLTITYQL